MTDALREGQVPETPQRCEGEVPETPQTQAPQTQGTPPGELADHSLARRLRARIRWLVARTEHGVSNMAQYKPNMWGSTGIER